MVLRRKTGTILTVAFIWLLVQGLAMAAQLSTTELHQCCLYPTVRVTTVEAGGGVYSPDTGEFIGVPSRLAVAFRGFSAIIATHMGFFIPAQRIYAFLEAQGHAFLYDPAAPSYETWLKVKKARKEQDD